MINAQDENNEKQQNNLVNAFNRNTASTHNTYKKRLQQHKQLSAFNVERPYTTNMNKQSFDRGFIKAAADSGINPIIAVGILKKYSEDKSSWLGRYMAAGKIPETVHANKRQILDELDPTGKLQDERLILSMKEYKKQRQLGYDMMPKTIKRESAGSVLKNLALGGVIGGGVGAAYGGMYGGLGGAGIGAGIGAAGLGGLMAGHRLYNKWEQKKINADDIKRMKKQQHERGFAWDLMPFSNMIDATKA